MSLSPFQSRNGQSAQGKPVHSIRLTQPSAKDEGHQPLTLSQALTITAGLAGLVGLLSGVFLRFSIVNSPNSARFSPLQTFPTLANGPPEPSADGHDTQRLDRTNSATLDPQGTQPIPTFEAIAPAESEETAQIVEGSSDITDLSTFDAFAARDQSRNGSAGDPLEALSKGPSFGLRQLQSDQPTSESTEGLIPNRNASDIEVYDDASSNIADEESEYEAEIYEYDADYSSEENAYSEDLPNTASDRYSEETYNDPYPEQDPYLEADPYYGEQEW